MATALGCGGASFGEPDGGSKLKCICHIMNNQSRNCFTALSCLNRGAAGTASEAVLHQPLILKMTTCGITEVQMLCNTTARRPDRTSVVTRKDNKGRFLSKPKRHQRFCRASRKDRHQQYGGSRLVTQSLQTQLALSSPAVILSAPCLLSALSSIIREGKPRSSWLPHWATCSAILHMCSTAMQVGGRIGLHGPAVVRFQLQVPS